MTIEKCHRCVGDTACENQVAEECLPIGAFGNLSNRLSNKSVEAVTIGLNPALNEFYELGYETPKPENQRLAVLSDYHATNRAGLSLGAVKQAKDKQNNYFTTETRQCHPYFSSLQRQISLINPQWRYDTGRVIHIDLVACATERRWKLLSARCKTGLKHNCRDFFLAKLSVLEAGTMLMPANKVVADGMAEIGLTIQRLNISKLFKPEVVRRWLGVVEVCGKMFPVMKLS